MTQPMRLAILGDIHAFWNEADVRHFNEQSFDLILFTGDLPNRVHWYSQRVAKSISQLKNPTLVMAGNHDGTTIWQMGTELPRWRFLAGLTSWRMEQRVQKLKIGLSPARLCGYETLEFPKKSLSLICARPHAMGGTELSIGPYLRRQYQINSINESAAHLKKLVSDSQTDNLLFLAHNGPAGLGSEANDIWGNDFAKVASDFGDPDLAEAIVYARQNGKKVRAVLAGHMHHHNKAKQEKIGQRKIILYKDETLFANCAAVPRIFQAEGQTWHIYYELEIHLEKKWLQWQEVKFSETGIIEKKILFKNKEVSN